MDINIDSINSELTDVQSKLTGIIMKSYEIKLTFGNSDTVTFYVDNPKTAKKVASEFEDVADYLEQLEK